MVILPIISTTTDWNNYLTTAKQILNRNLSSQIDKHKIKTDSLVALLTTIENLKYPDSSPVEVLTEAGSVLRHAFVGFMVLATTKTIFEIMESTSLDVTSTDTTRGRLAVVSGNLQQWRTAIINGEPLEFLNKCLIYFESIGLAQLWCNFRKVMQQDSTFLLEEK